MIEVTITCDLLPGIDEKDYWDFIRRGAAAAANAKGLVEFRAHRNVLSTPTVRITTVWGELTNGADLMQCEEWQAMDMQIGKFAQNIKTEIWTPSPYLSESVNVCASLSL